MILGRPRSCMLAMRFSAKSRLADFEIFEFRFDHF